ncbi:hypothetical protein DFH06DRAFT_1312766 [Mycena polygramma]|nr:hypothetical protein DFH06DRAFT_1312766 [Mycena polygramma]
MSDHLPDEIISEILSPALKVTDEVFSDTSAVSPFAKYSESTSAYLLVCKSWLRVATPLLYNVVILRSKAQAKALSLVLTKDKQLGQFIKKLRVEGGYGPSMGIILEHSPRISDLFLSLEIYSSDNTGGLCKGLPLINPTRLILRDSGFTRRRPANKMLSQLVEGLGKVMCDWDHLVVFHCPYTSASNMARQIFLPLEKSKRLHTLVIPSATGLSWAYSALEKCPLQAIHIEQTTSVFQQRYVDNLEDASLQALVKFRDAPAFSKAKVQASLEFPQIAPSLDPSFIPLAGASEEVYNTILSRILYFAMSVPDMDNNPTSRGIPPRLPLLMVTKTFNRIGMCHYYSHILLRSPSSTRNLASVISKNQLIGSHVRAIDGSFLGSQFSSEAEYDALHTSMLEVLSQTTGLVRMGRRHAFAADDLTLILGKTEISWAAFVAMAECSGATLRDLSISISKSLEQESTTTFSHFTALRSLDLICGIDSIDLKNTPADGFPSLEELRISSTSQSFLTALSLMKLESLRRLVISYQTTAAETVLTAHGAKLTDLDITFRALEILKVPVFKLCPNLSCITVSAPGWIYDAPQRAEDLQSVEAVPSLVKIILDASFYSKRKEEAATWDRFFVNFNPTCFPNLREMEVKCCVWPTSERDIAKSCWVRWAESLLKHNVSLMDKTGKKWRPRLQAK